MENNEIAQDLDSAMKSILVENNAQTIFDHLNHIEKQQDVYAKRWFWELLQNAKDAVEIKRDEKVSIKVLLEKTKLVFSHTGNAFNQDDVLHLIFHGSSKKKLEGKIGRFGTGFMATHLLSRKVVIAGKLEDSRSFKFELSREAKDVPQQKANLDNSFIAFKNSIKQDSYTTAPYNTVFEYELNEGTEIAQKGIDQLQFILPFVLAFNPEIENIEVSANQKQISIIRGKSSETKEEDYTITEQEIILDNKSMTVILLSTKDSDIGVLIDTSKETWEVVDLNESYSKLFFDFPLLGTEKLGCPIVINSTKFDLRGERDGIYLGSDDKPTITENKRIVEQSLLNFSHIIKHLSNRRVTGLFNLFRISKPFNYEWLQSDWLEGKLRDLVPVLLETECCFTLQQPVKLNSIVIPFGEIISNTEFYKLISEFSPNLSPPLNENEQWIVVAKGFSELDNKHVSAYDFIVNEKKLCEQIELCQTLESLNQHISKVIDAENILPGIAWLNDFFNLLSKEQTEFFSSLYKIIPNQNETLVTRTTESPSLDGIGDDKIKKVAESFGWDIESELVYPSIRMKDGVLPKFTLEKVIQTIFQLSEKIPDGFLTDSKNRKALIHFFKWLLTNRRIDDLKSTYVIVEDSRESSETSYSKRRLFLSNSDRLLSPFQFWQTDFSLYRDLVKRKFILIDEYFEHLTTDDFNYLSQMELIFLTPLIKRTKATKQELKLLLKKEEEYFKLPIDKEELNFEFSDIPYLTRSDDGILIKTGEAIKSGKILLKFLLTQVLDKDLFFDKQNDVVVGQNTISLNKSLWLSRLRATQWVPVKFSDDENKYYNQSERASVSNFTELLKGEPELLNEIKKKNAALFFNQLGLSVADIIRNTLVNEEDKLAWDMTFSHLLTSGNIKPELAVEMLQDPKLQEVYQSQKDRRDKIKENQNIGYLFEKIFRDIFDSKEFKQDGFTINRTAIGSDFGVVYEHDVLDDNGKETLFKIDQILIELKATGKNYAEMTPTQGEEATKNSNNYVLAVLPLKGYEIKEESVREHTRFVIDIAKPLKKRYDEFLSYTGEKQKVIQDQEGVNLFIEDGKIRYQVKEDVWESSNALTFECFVTWIKSKNKIINPSQNF